MGGGGEKKKKEGDAMMQWVNKAVRDFVPGGLIALACLLCWVCKLWTWSLQRVNKCSRFTSSCQKVCK